VAARSGDFWLFGEASAKEHARSGLTTYREAIVPSRETNSWRAWEAKLSRNDAKNQKDRFPSWPFRVATVFVKML
jgi:hypothetical protein